jgi:hypothetical protein
VSLTRYYRAAEVNPTPTPDFLFFTTPIHANHTQIFSAQPFEQSQDLRYNEMEHHQPNFNNTIIAHAAYQQAISQDEKGDVEGLVSSPYQIPMASISGTVGPPKNVHPGSYVGQGQTQTFHEVAPNGTCIHPGGYGHQYQPSYPFAPNNPQERPQLYDGHLAPRYSQDHPALEGAIQRAMTDQRGIPVPTNSLPQDRRPWSLFASSSPSSWRGTQKQETPTQSSDIRKPPNATNHGVLQRWGDSTFDYREWRTQNAMKSYQIDIVESLRFIPELDRRVLLESLEKIGWPLRLRSIEELEGRFAPEDTSSLWSKEDNRALVLLRQHFMLSWPVLANKFFLGRFEEECERQFELLYSKNAPLHTLDPIFESDLLVEQTGYLQNLTSAEFFKVVKMTAFTSLAVKTLADTHWLENHKTSIIDSLTLKDVPLDLDQKLAIRDSLQATGWPTNLRSFQGYKNSARDHRGPWNEDDKKALVCLGELLPKRYDMIVDFFPGRTILGIKDRWNKCTGAVRDRTSASPEPSYIPRPEVSLLKTTLLKATSRAAPNATPKAARAATLKAARATAPAVKAAKSQTAWTNEEEKKLLRLRNEGITWGDIAQDLGRSELALKTKIDRLNNKEAARRKEKKVTARQKIASENRKSSETENRIDTQIDGESEESESDTEPDWVVTLDDVFMGGTKAYSDTIPEDHGQGGQEDIWTADEIQRLHQGKSSKKGWARIQSVHLPNRSVESLMQKWEEITGRPNRKGYRTTEGLAISE